MLPHFSLQEEKLSGRFEDSQEVKTNTGAVQVCDWTDQWVYFLLRPAAAAFNTTPTSTGCEIHRSHVGFLLVASFVDSDRFGKVYKKMFLVQNDQSHRK